MGYNPNNPASVLEGPRNLAGEGGILGKKDKGVFSCRFYVPFPYLLRQTVETVFVKALRAGRLRGRSLEQRLHRWTSGYRPF